MSLVKLSTIFYDTITRIAAFERAKGIRKKNPEVFEKIMNALQGFPQNKMFIYSGVVFDHVENSGLPEHEAINDAVSTIHIFERVKPHLEQKDIQQYNSYAELNEVVQKANLEIGAKKKQKDKAQEGNKKMDYAKQQQAIEAGDATKVFEDAENVVYRINSRDGSRALGSDTPWCITKQRGYFDMYTSNNLIFYFAIDKTREEWDPLQKTAIRVVRDFDGNVTEMKATKKTNDGDNKPISIVPGHENFENILKQDAEQQPIGLSSLIRSGKATQEQVEEYWNAAHSASINEKLNMLRYIGGDLHKVSEDMHLVNNGTEEELVKYWQEHPNNAAIMERLAQVTDNQEVLTDLYKSQYYNVQEEVAKKTNNPAVIRDAANSTYNSVKTGLVLNLKHVDRSVVDYIKENLHDDGNYLEEDDYYRDLYLIKKRLEIDEKSPEDIVNSDYFDFYTKHFLPYASKGFIERIQETILKSEDPSLAYKFARDVPGADIEKMQETILKLENPSLAYRFARNVPGADIERIQEIILKSENPSLAYKFARDVPGVNIEKMQNEVVIPRGDYSILLNFARDVPGADIERIQETILKSEDPYLALGFAQNIYGADIERIQEIILKSENPSLAYKFARDVPGADIERIQEIILKSEEPSLAYKFARDVPGADIERIQEIILESERSDFSLLIELSRLPDADIGSIEDYVIEYGEYDEIITFAQSVPRANIRRIQFEIFVEDEENGGLVKEFQQKVQDFDLFELQESVLKTQDKGLIEKYFNIFKDQLISEFQHISNEPYFHNLYESVIKTQDKELIEKFTIFFKDLIGTLIEPELETGLEPTSQINNYENTETTENYNTYNNDAINQNNEYNIEQNPEEQNA